MMVKPINRASILFRQAAYLSLLLLAILVLTGCSAAAATPTTAPVVVEPTATQAATATVPAPTATEAATATLEPTATLVPTEPPTATAVPALAVLADGGFNVWCAPENYAGTLPTSPDAPGDARLLTTKDSQMSVQIPAAYCAVVFRFNQPAPAALQVVLYDGSNPFMKLPLTPADGHPDEAWATLRHAYVINPPLWFVTYRVAVTSADGKELWSNPVKFTKSLPPTCVYTNQLPDPVTGWCPITDPYEVEPHPDANYPYDHNRLLTPSPEPKH